MHLAYPASLQALCTNNAKRKTPTDRRQAVGYMKAWLRIVELGTINQEQVQQVARLGETLQITSLTCRPLGHTAWDNTDAYGYSWRGCAAQFSNPGPVSDQKMSTHFIFAYRSFFLIHSHIHFHNSLKTHTQFHTKMGKVYNYFQTEMA